MDTINISTVDELAAQLADLDDDSLFRGQTKQYIDAHGNVSMPTSFTRHGCVPSLQIKWAHYAAFILRALTGSPITKFDIHRPQAVLQHYGWRSFFIDASENAAVSAWFASHAFSVQNILNGSEDCFEEFIITEHQKASYNPVDSTVFLYVVSRDVLSQLGIECFNLTELQAKDCRPRFHAQAAWLIGPLQEKLPVQSVTKCLTGPAEIFSEYAALAGYKKTSDLFPPRTDDPILELLLSVPWEAVGDESGIPAFSRGLLIPEYDYSVVKFHPANYAFFRTFWIADARGPTDSPLAKAAFFRIPEALFYGLPTDNLRRLTKVQSILEQHGSIVIESERMLRHPEHHTQTEYLKGVYVRLVEPGIIEVCELTVDHPGTLVSSAGLTKGWYYRILSAGCWSRHIHADECPCNNELLHYHHLWVVNHFEELLADTVFLQRAELDYSHTEITA